MEATSTQSIAYFSDPRSVHTHRWVNYFAEHGWRVSLVTWSPPTREEREAINPSIEILPIKRPLKLLKLFKQKPDIIHGHYISHYGILAAIFKKIAGGTLCQTAWGTDILKGRKGCRKWLTRWALTQSKIVTCDAQHMAKTLANTSTDIEKIRIINFGTDTDTYRPTNMNTRTQTNMNTYTPVVISLRAHKPLYDLGTLIKAAAKIAKTHKTRFAIAGDGPMWKTHMKMVSELGANNTSLPGNIPPNQVAEELAKADIYVNTSLSDAGLAASTAEAMACGLPIITTDFGDNPKWIKPQQNGLLFEPRNADQLAEQIAWMIEHPLRRRMMGKIGRRIIQNRDNNQKEMKKMEEIYAKCAPT